MTGNQKKECEALDRLADALVDDILIASDEDILAETVEDGGDPATIGAEMRSLFERTAIAAGKTKLAAAKQGAANVRLAGADVVKIDPVAARRRYEAMIARDRSLSDKLTLAARNGEGQSKRDIDSAIEDLAELGAFDDEDENA